MMGFLKEQRMTRFLRRAQAAAFIVSAAFAAACGGGETTAAPKSASDAKQFLGNVNNTMLRLSIEAAQAGWVAQTYITEDTEALDARATQNVIEAVARYAKEAAAYNGIEVPADDRRQLDLLKLSLSMVTPADPGEATELTKIVSRLRSAYGRGKWCADPAKPPSCMNIDDITKVMAESRNEQELRRVWEGWHTISPPMRNDYARFVELSNKGAKELGFADTGAMWRQKYDMPADEFTKELDRLWEQVRPLYVKLHAYVRMKLRAKYGDAVPQDGPLPAHLLGNIWAQDWGNIYSLVSPGTADAGYSLTEILKRRQTSALDMVKIGERFYTSLGFAPLPETFWQRSLFVRPQDREVVCHASAWDIDAEDDIRIKMCIQPTEEDFNTIHHELGHNFYQRAYKAQPVILRDSANDGFHEAIGDAIALSVTPEYLVRIGLLDKAPDASRDIGLLMTRALEKVAFLPFGLLIDQWRWKVFSGEVTPANYNKAWWDLRLKYQGVAPSTPRGEEFFDPGAKYHVPDNTSYTRYFLAHILQFQFHRAMSQTAGCKSPLHRCSIYESKEAGQRLNAMLTMGLSRPWPDALEALTGSRQMDASAILDYFAPLDKWLDEQIKGQKTGW
jgi:peptidyl-dipeptidase A